MTLRRLRDLLRPRLRTVLLIVNLTVVVLPLGTIFLFRIYENELVQQTEAELIAQGSLIDALFRQLVAEQIGDAGAYGVEVHPEVPPPVDLYYTPVLPQIDLARNALLPPRPDGFEPARPADPVAHQLAPRLTAILVETQKTTLAGLTLLDYRGTEVAGRFAQGRSFAHVWEVREALAGRYASVIRERISDEPPPPIASISRGTGIRVFIAMPIMQDNRLWGVAYLSRTPSNVLKQLYEARRKVFLAGLTMLAVTLALAVFTSWSIASPINALIERTRRVSRGERDATAPLGHYGTREVELLSTAFADMADSLHARSDYIRDFATHVSHEFKTPLAAIQGAAELLHDHFDTMEPLERERFVDNIVADTQRLERLVARLLDLARADSLEPSPETAPLDPLFDELAGRYAARGLEITTAGDSGAAVRMNADNLDTVLANLLDNALQHGAGAVGIRVDRRDGEVGVTVTDDGRGVSPANAGKVFTPFFTTRRDDGGTGLGLGIVASILDAHKGRIALLPCETGAAFEMVLPAAAQVDA